MLKLASTSVHRVVQKMAQILLGHSFYFRIVQPHEISHRTMTICFHHKYESLNRSEKNYGYERCLKKECQKIQYHRVIDT